jgi:glycerophosphoryl diester phosphodiesterase
MRAPHSMICAYLVACAAALSTAGEETSHKHPARDLVLSDRVLVIGHRGDSLVCPENTLPAFESAVGCGCDLVELDYFHSADGVPVVVHDKTLDRTTDAKEIFSAEQISVKSKSLAELMKLDAGKWFDVKFAGTRLPTLEEALDTIQKGSLTLIERKAGDAKTLVDLLRRKNLVRNVVVQAFDWDFLADCHALEPDLVLGALGNNKLDDAKLANVERTGARVIGWEANFLRAATIQRIHDAGYRSWAWTVDNPDKAQRLLAAGVNGLITNVPSQMKALLAEQSQQK